MSQEPSLKMVQFCVLWRIETILQYIHLTEDVNLSTQILLNKCEVTMGLSSLDVGGQVQFNYHL